MIPGTERMALMLPLRYGMTVSGVLVLTNADGCADCGQDDLILGQGLADQAAVAIANAQLLAQTRETAMLEERTRLARDIRRHAGPRVTGIVVQLGAARRLRWRSRRTSRASIWRWPSAWPANRWPRRGGRWICGRLR